jgi:CMP-2-keto-3-deoxyoctulosonic acid synthetase
MCWRNMEKNTGDSSNDITIVNYQGREPKLSKRLIDAFDKMWNEEHNIPALEERLPRDYNCGSTDSEC